MKEITFPTMVFIIVNIPETKLYTRGLIDTSSEITIFKIFLLKEWKDTKISIKGVTINKEKNYTTKRKSGNNDLECVDRFSELFLGFCRDRL